MHYSGINSWTSSCFPSSFIDTSDFILSHTLSHFHSFLHSLRLTATYSTSSFSASMNHSVTAIDYQQHLHLCQDPFSISITSNHQLELVLILSITCSSTASLPCPSSSRLDKPDFGRPLSKHIVYIFLLLHRWTCCWFRYQILSPYLRIIKISYTPNQSKPFRTLNHTLSLSFIVCFNGNKLLFFLVFSQLQWTQILLARVWE